VLGRHTKHIAIMYTYICARQTSIAVMCTYRYIRQTYVAMMTAVRTGWVYQI